MFDTPDKIEAYRLLATVHGLRMELTVQMEHGFPPTACPTRGMALRSAQRILRQYEQPVHRTRRKCLAQMEELCQQLGIEVSPSRPRRSS